MRTRKPEAILSTLCVSLVLAGCGPGEYGDNETRGGAFQIELDRQYEARIARKSDAGWFKFTTAHGAETFDLIEISVDADSGLVPHVAVFDTEGRSVGEATAAGAGQSLEYVFATRGDTFYLRFTGWDMDEDSDRGSKGTYSFSVKNLFANDDLAPNHEPAEAAELELDSVHDGVLVSPLEVDYFAFSTAHGDDTFDEVSVLLSVRSLDLCARLELFDSTGQEIHSSISPNPGEGVAHTFVTTGGSFLVRVSGWDPDDNRDHGSAGSYQLRVINGFANDEFAPNHSLADASEVELAKTYQGVLVSEEEADYYRFTTGHTADEYDTVAFQAVARDPELMLYIELYDHFGNRSNLSAKAAAPGEIASLGWISPGGVRQIRVSGWDPVGNRDHGSSGAYSFRVWNLDNNDPFMGNHSFEHAYPIELDTEYDAVLLCISETDWFIVENAKPGEIYSVHAMPMPGLAIHVEIYDSRRVLVHEATATASGADLTTTFESPGDAFVIRFSGWSLAANRDNGSRGAYTFRVGKS